MIFSNLAEELAAFVGLGVSPGHQRSVLAKEGRDKHCNPLLSL